MCQLHRKHHLAKFFYRNPMDLGNTLSIFLNNFRYRPCPLLQCGSYTWASWHLLKRSPCRIKSGLHELHKIPSYHSRRIKADGIQKNQSWCSDYWYRCTVPRRQQLYPDDPRNSQQLLRTGNDFIKARNPGYLLSPPFIGKNRQPSCCFRGLPVFTCIKITIF